MNWGYSNWGYSNYGWGFRSRQPWGFRSRQPHYYSYRGLGAAPTCTPEILQFGSKGPAVGALQKKLGIPVDDDFGPQTLRALQQAQLEAGQVTSGKVTVSCEGSGFLGGGSKPFPWVPVILVGVLGLGVAIALGTRKRRRSSAGSVDAFEGPE